MVRRRGGRGGGGGRGRGGRGGGARWGDPKWRAAKLAELADRDPRPVVHEHSMAERLTSWANASGPDEELKLEDLPRDGVELVHRLAGHIGLHSQSYGKGRSTVVVVAKRPLERYRAELDARHGRKDALVHMSSADRDAIEHVLDRIRQPTSHPGAPFAHHPQPAAPPAEPRACWEDLEDADLVAVSAVAAVPAATVDASLVRGQPIGEDDTPRGLRGMRHARSRLPAAAMEAELLAAIRRHQVVVVSGETGCGKTTQVPQFVLDDSADCNIVCTQPRRISAVAVAERVAHERNEAVGGTVGYQIRHEARRSDATRLLFCTTGVLLRTLINDPVLSGVSHVVVDEIHERGVNEDFLLVVLRDLLPKRPHDLKVILMSATLNASTFSNYFESGPGAAGAKVPRVHIPGFTFPVREMYLDELIHATNHFIPPHEQPHPARRPPQPQTHTAEASLGNWTGENQLELAQVAIRFIVANSDRLERDPDTRADDPLSAAAGLPSAGAILVFLSGWDEIKLLHEQLRADPVLGGGGFWILPCHSALPTAEQRQIFAAPPQGVRKVVLSTNIAETSITIDDVVFVVDLGKAKEKTFDAVNNLECLMPAWISRASARQRRGRAGRVRAGWCIHLYPRRFHDQLAEYQAPEILRTPLESLCLQIKSLQLGFVAPFLAKAIEPPSAKAVTNAVEMLQQIGALSTNEDLTALGRHLAHLPIEPCLGKMLVFGLLMGCLSPVLTIAASLAHRAPFVMPMDKKEVADEAKARFADGSCSDHLAVLNAFNEWSEVRKRRPRDEESWCWHNFLNKGVLRTMAETRRQLVDLLRGAGFVIDDNDCAGDADVGAARGGRGRANADSVNARAAQLPLVRAVLCAGLFPKVAAVRNSKRAKWHTRDDGKVDPHPSSVNAWENQFEYQWMVYNEKVRSVGGIYIRDSTNVSDLALLLFGGQLVETDSTQAAASRSSRAADMDGSLRQVSMLRGYINFRADTRTVALVLELRHYLDRMLQAKIDNPRLTVAEAASAIAGRHPNAGAELQDVVASLLRAEDGYGLYQPDEIRRSGGGPAASSRPALASSPYRPPHARGAFDGSGGGGGGGGSTYASPGPDSTGAFIGGAFDHDCAMPRSSKRSRGERHQQAHGHPRQGLEPRGAPPCSRSSW